MDNEERLKLLRRRGKTTSRPETVSRTWEKIDRDQSLSTKEKLQRLISLTRTKERPKPESPAVKTSAGSAFQVYENHYSQRGRYGRIPLSAGLKVKGEVLRLLSRDTEFSGLDLSSALFLDLETTGLSGGTGVVPFLIGLGFFSEGQFHVLQYFLCDLSEEENLIAELDAFFSRMNFSSIVSYNGKRFDLPLLETRFILQRRVFPLAELPHLDFLFSARSLWKHKHESCRLCHLAREVVQADRLEDIPSAEIPQRYFQYLRTGDFSLIEPILYHNQEDLLSLLGVVIAGAMLVAGEGESVLGDIPDGFDLFGAGKLFESAGDTERSVRLFESALEKKLSRDVAVLTKKKLSYHFKKSRDWERAIAFWKDMAPENQLFCFRELAMYYEHHEKNYGEAIRFAEEGMSAPAAVSAFHQRDFFKRLERLRKKERLQLKGEKNG